MPVSVANIELISALSGESPRLNDDALQGLLDCMDCDGYGAEVIPPEELPLPDCV